MLCGAAAAEQAARHVQARPQRLPIREPPAALPTCAAALALSPCRLRACWLQCLDNNQTEQCASASYKVAKVALERLQDADAAEAGGAATKTVLAAAVAALAERKSELRKDALRHLILKNAVHSCCSHMC